MATREVSLFVIEDDDIDFLTIQRSLARKRISNPVFRASDGEKALKMLVNGDIPNPFVILLDLQMPCMNGIEFLTLLRQNQDYARFKDSVVFILSSSEDEKDIVKSYQHYVAGYFVKEHTGDGFLDIADVLGGYWKIVHLPIKD